MWWGGRAGGKMGALPRSPHAAMTLLLPALLALPLSVTPDPSGLPARGPVPGAAASRVGSARRPDGLPLDDWRERLARVGALSFELALTSSEGSGARVRFAYEAPDRCALWTDVEGEPTMRVWLEAGVATWHTRAEDDGWTTGSFDWAELAAPSGEWLEELREAFPAPERGEEHGEGPVLDLWPDLDADRIELTLAHSSSAPALFTWLARLERADLEVEPGGEGWSAVVDGEVRLLLEPELGIPRGVWMGTGDDARRALELVSLELDGEPDEALLEVGAAPRGALDRSDQLAAVFGVKDGGWVRVTGYAWLAARVEDGLAPDDEAEALRVGFEGLHAGWSGEGLARRRDGELAQLDEWLDRVGVWYEENREAEGAAAKLVEVLAQGRAGAEERLSRIAQQYAVRLEAPSGEGADADALDALHALEQEAVAGWIERELAAPVRTHLAERLAEFGVELPE